MLTCIACPKHLGSGSLRYHEDDDDDDDGTPRTRQAIKALTSQIKDMALKASGAYRHCKPCTGSSATRGRRYEESSELASGSERIHHFYRCAGAGGRFGFGSGSTPRLRGMSSSEGTPSASGMNENGMMTAFVDEGEDCRDWVAQVEPGILLTFFSLPLGGNELKRIRFSREMYDKWQAQRWWAENHDRVMELYNVARFNLHSISLPTPPTSEDENSKRVSAQESPETPPLRNERLPRHLHRPMNGNSSYVMGYSSSDSVDYQRSNCHHHRHHEHHNSRYCYVSEPSGGLPSTPKLSSISGNKIEISSMDASVRTSSYPEEVDHSGELSASVSNISDQEREWVEEDEPGVYITIRSLYGGIKELRRIRFSRERFGETQAKLWWEENRARIHDQYLS